MTMLLFMTVADENQCKQAFLTAACVLAVARLLRISCVCVHSPTSLRFPFPPSTWQNDWQIGMIAVNWQKVPLSWGGAPTPYRRGWGGGFGGRGSGDRAVVATDFFNRNFLNICAIKMISES